MLYMRNVHKVGTDCAVYACSSYEVYLSSARIASYGFIIFTLDAVVKFENENLKSHHQWSAVADTIFKR